LKRIALGIFLAAWVLGGRGATTAEEDDGGWPFGVAAPPNFVMDAKDLFNLGLLGAKAEGVGYVTRPARPLPRDFGRVGGAREPEDADAGPTRLRVTILFPKGPAQKAGLRLGDVIVGIGEATFDKGALGPLAQALVAAEAGERGGVLTLLVEREGERLTIEAKIPPGGEAAARPTEGKARDDMVKAACRWLASRQLGTGGFRETLAGRNGAVVQAATAGLAWLAGGSDLRRGSHRKNVRLAMNFVIEHAGIEDWPTGLGAPGAVGPPGGRGLTFSTDQTNWGLAHAAIFLGELHARSPSRVLGKELHRIATTLAERQEATGGWAHGPGGANALGYVELNIVTALALSGLGLASQSGWEPPEAVIEKAEAYLEASGSPDGGVGYSTANGQRGFGNIGRTAGAWLGMVGLGLRDRPWSRKMEAWTAANVDAVLGGHASLMQHILLAGVAAQALGETVQERFWAKLERDLVLARAPDDSFQPRPWHESLLMGSNTDVEFGEVWTTAAWTVVLGARPRQDGKGGLPAWCPALGEAAVTPR
jgi:membrane-associated protease RseP (regulator of RpoE activity)